MVTARSIAGPPDVCIAPLLDHPQHVAFVAGLVYRTFWANVPDGLTEDYLVRAFSGQAEPGRVLGSWVALAPEASPGQGGVQAGRCAAAAWPAEGCGAGVPLGCVHLIDHDDDTLPEWSPWLAAMVVVPERRGQGIGSMLVRALLHEARARGIARVWLGTDGPGFYERLGARRQLQRSDRFWTMAFDLDAAAPQPGAGGHAPP